MPQNGVSDEILYLARRVFSSNCIRVEYFIFQGCRRSEEEARQGRGGLETRGDVLIRVLWKIQTGAIIGVRFGDADADTYKYEPMDKLLDCWVNQNMDKHNKHYHEQRKVFSIFPLS